MAHQLRQETQNILGKPWSKNLNREKRKQAKAPQEPHEKRPKAYRKGQKMGHFGTSLLKPFGT